jgi:phosphatidylglycerol:prolipoprotein diacylglycerol transferase
MLKRLLTLIIAGIFLIILEILLNQVFSGRIILPQSFNLGPLTIHYYGVIMALAVASGFYLASKRAPKYGIGARQAENLLFWLIIGGFIGARLYHVASSYAYYAQHPLDMVKVWNGGLSVYGALFGGCLVLLIWKKIANRKSTPPHPPLVRGGEGGVLDWLTPSIILGQIIGRFGNLFNYEAFGYPTKLPWKMFVPAAFRPPEFMNSQFFHPWFLYEALGNAIIFIVILKWFNPPSGHPKNSFGIFGESPTSPPLAGVPQNSKSFGVDVKGGNRGVGSLFFTYVLLYNGLRFCLEFIRSDSVLVSGFRQNAAMSLALVLVSLLTLYLFYRRDQNAKVS